MRTLVAALLLALLAPSAALGAEPGGEPPPGKSGLYIVELPGPQPASPQPARQQPKAGLTLPARVEGQPGDFIPVQAQTEGKTVCWVALDPGLTVFPSALLKDTRATVVVARKPGSYRLLAYTAVGGEPTEPAITVVVVGGGPPEPPPEPADPLAQRLKGALAADPVADRAYLAQLTSFYRVVSEMDLAKYRTTGDLFAALDEAKAALMPRTVLPVLRAAVGTELNPTLPADRNAEPTAEQRAAFKAAAGRVARALESLK